MSDCCATKQMPIILACSGGSNVGQMSNRLAIELTKAGQGKMFCLAGVGAGLPGFVQPVKDAAEVVVIEGCPVGCAKKVLENVGVTPTRYVLLTELGMEKNKNLDLDEADVSSLMRAMVGQSVAGAKPGKGCGCGRG